MKALKNLTIVALAAFSPTLQAADTFVSHFESLQGMQVRDVADEPVALSFEALGKRFDMNLEVNDRVVDALPTGAAYEGLSVYRGRLADNPDSWVRIVMFNGMPRGVVWDGVTMYAIETPGDSAIDTAQPVIYRASDLNILPGTMSCDTADISGDAAKVLSSMKGEWGTSVSQAAGATSEITVSVLGDSLFTADQGGDAEAAAAITARFNNVDGYFSEQVGVQLKVEHIQTYDSASDPFSGTLDSGLLLDELSELRLQTSALRSRGLTHLYTGRNFDTSTVGVAWRGGLCDSYFSAGLSEGRAGVFTDSLVAAHEIGHNFNAEHDGKPDGSCPSEPETYIMAPSVNGSQQFSPCSITVMQAEAARSSCVVPLPSVDVGISRNTQPSTVLLGANTVIDYEVAANGTLDAADVVANFTIPGVLSLDAITATAGTCTSGAGTASCDLGNMAGLSSQTVTITTTPVAVGTGTLSASVTTSGADERSSNNQDSLRLTVNPAVDLVVNAPATAPAFVDTSTTVTVQLENRSTLAASDVSVTVTLDNGLRADSASWPIGTCTVSAQQIDCQAGSFAAQSNNSLRITASAVSTGMQDVSVSISSAEADADTSNNSATRAVNVVTPQGEGDDSSGGGTTSPLFLLFAALIALGRRSTRPCSRPWQTPS